MSYTGLFALDKNNSCPVKQPLELAIFRRDTNSDSTQSKELRETIEKIAICFFVLFSIITLAKRTFIYLKQNITYPKNPLSFSFDTIRNHNDLLKIIDTYKTLYENAYLKQDDEDTLCILFNQKIRLDENKIVDLEENLKMCLEDCKRYEEVSEQVEEIVYVALEGLLEKPMSNKRVDFAEFVSKQLSGFLRKYTDKKYIGIYKEYLNNQLFAAGSVERKPSAYLIESAQINHGSSKKFLKYHVSTIYLLKQLRKQITLQKNFEYIKLNIKENDQIKKIPNKIVEEALKYLNLTWMHGTTAYSIQTACRYLNREILPLGKLKERKIWVLSGEVSNGSTALGINIASISGVGLPHAKVSIGYANNFILNYDHEEKKYLELLNMKFNKVSDFLNYDGRFSRGIEALRRVKFLRSEKFIEDKGEFKQLLKNIYTGMTKVIFDQKPRDIFDWHDTYYSSKFYTFLKAVEELEDIVNGVEDKFQVQSLDDVVKLAQIPIVMASTTKYGKYIYCSELEEPSEAICENKMILGKDIQVIFTGDDNIDLIQNLLKEHNLANSVHVVSIRVLQAASKIDRVLGSYFYDVYDIKQWTSE